VEKTVSLNSKRKGDLNDHMVLSNRGHHMPRGERLNVVTFFYAVGMEKKKRKGSSALKQDFGRGEGKRGVPLLNGDTREQGEKTRFQKDEGTFV